MFIKAGKEREHQDIRYTNEDSQKYILTVRKYFYSGHVLTFQPSE